jgi:hypothetical protein
MTKITRQLPVHLAIVLALTSAVGTRALATGLNVYGLGADKNTNEIVRFDSNAPGAIDGPNPVTGLVAGDELVGIDVRPATGQLYGLAVNDIPATSNVVRLYTIDPDTLVATAVGMADIGVAAPGNTIIGATSFGVDFNPTVDRVRVVNNLASDGAGGNANNFRLNPNNGSLVAIDPDLDFTGLPGGNANAPEVGVAYTNNIAGATTTMLFGIVAGGDRLVRNAGAGPGFPTLMNVGLLGVDTSNNVGFDIVRQDTAFAILDAMNNSSGFYTIDLATGTATSVGTIGSGEIVFAGMTIVPDSAGAPAVSTLVLLAIGAGLLLAGIRRLSRSPARSRIA